VQLLVAVQQAFVVHLLGFPHGAITIFSETCNCAFKMARGNGIHWYVPTMMFGAFVAGALLAAGHHLFYESLNGQPVSDGAFLDSPVSKQQANIAIGTALAFLVKACLAFSVSLAFVQVFWSVSHARGMIKPPTMERLDLAYGSLDNFWVLFNVVLWWRYPTLLAIASMAWYVTTRRTRSGGETD
jgi:hypothetical protein